ncbi:MAG TPA: hypothetical protein VIH57_17985 [Bacteroidales bacterium]
MKKSAKIVFLFSLVALFHTAVYGQYFKEKDKVLNLGIGFGSAIYASGASSSFPPLSASFEYGVKEGVGPGVIGIGGLLGYTSAKYNDFGFNWRTSYTVIGVRGSYHLVDLADKLDAYGGIMLGYSIVSSSGDFGTYSTASSGANFGIFAGARYYLSDKFALMAELGYGFAILNVGVAIKL